MVAPFLLFGRARGNLRCNLFRLGSQIRARHRGLDKQLTLPRQHPHHDDRLEPPPDSAINIGLPTSRWPTICPAENASSKDSDVTAPPFQANRQEPPMCVPPGYDAARTTARRIEILNRECRRLTRSRPAHQE